MSLISVSNLNYYIGAACCWKQFFCRGESGVYYIKMWFILFPFLSKKFIWVSSVSYLIVLKTGNCLTATGEVISCLGPYYVEDFMWIKGSLLQRWQAMRERRTEMQANEFTPYHPPEVWGKGSMHAVSNPCCHIVNTSIWAKAVWGIHLFTFQNVACLMGLSQILKYSKITCKCLWEFFQHHCKEVECYFLGQKKKMQFQEFDFPRFSIAILPRKMKHRTLESTRSKRQICHLHICQNLHP